MFNSSFTFAKIINNYHFSHLKKYLNIIFGSSILSFGIYNIHSQSNITEGGILGFLLLINHWFNISPGIVSPIIDITCFIIGFKFLGKYFLKSSFIATISFSLSYNFWQAYPPVFPNLSDNLLIAAILGGVFVGVGVGICVRHNAAAGADDTLALIFKHFSKKSISKFYLASDITILCLSLSYIRIHNIFFSLISVIISGYIIGKISSK